MHVLLTLALEESASRRELASVLISDLYGSTLINSRDVAEGKLLLYHMCVDTFVSLCVFVQSLRSLLECCDSVACL